MFAKICGNVCKESFFACLLISPEIWSGVYHFRDLTEMIGAKKGRPPSPKQSTNHLLITLNNHY